MNAKSKFKPSIDQRIKGLDELRGIAILLVMFSHYFELSRSSSFLGNLNIGGFAVDVFFVISGFLIGKILIKAKREKDYFRKFYIRRLFRIGPLYYLVVLLVLSACIATNYEHSSWPLYLVFLQNLIPEASGIGNFFETSMVPLPTLGPLWSLAVEENFYAVAPLIVLLVPTNRLGYLLFAVSLVGVTLKHFATLNLTQSYVVGYTNPFETWFRMQYLAVGVLLNLQNCNKLIFAICIYWVSLIGVFQAWGALLEIVLGTLSVWLISNAIHGKLVLQNRFLAWLGVHCFGLYVLHIPIKEVVQAIAKRVVDLPDWLYFGPFLAVCILAAHISFKYFEMPIQSLRTRFETSRRKAAA